MRLFLIRHGESEANRLQMYAGQTNVPLSDKGREDALSIKPILEEIKFDKLYSSDLKRAVETFEIAMPGKECEKTKLIREIDVGILTGLYIEDMKKEYGELFNNSRAVYNFKPFKGESSEDVAKRGAEFLKMLEEKPYNNVAAFCHAAFSCIMLGHITGTTENLDKKALICNNCAINIFEFDGEKWRLLCWNYGCDLSK